MTILKEKIIRYETDGRIVKGYDAGELIRCRDCKWYIAQYGQCLDHDDDVLWLEDSYCSRAVRKEECEN